jgi:hypothetical protein
MLSHREEAKSLMIKVIRDSLWKANVRITHADYSPMNKTRRINYDYGNN